MRQYQRDRNPSDLIFRARTVVHFAVDPNQVYMTTRLAGEQTRFLPFNQGSGGAGQKGGAGNPANPDGYDTAYLWEQVWQRDAWLGPARRVRARRGRVRRRRAQDRRDDDAVPALSPVGRGPASCSRRPAQAGPGTNRLIQHSAGSGKSNTIAWAAHHLSRLHTPSCHGELTDAVTAAGLGVDQPIFNKVIVITDRVVLDRQLQSTVAGFAHTPGTIVKIDEDSTQLRAALAGNTARIIITTLQKFPVVAEQAGVGGRQPVRRDRRRGALVHVGRGDEGHEDASSAGIDAGDRPTPIRSPSPSRPRRRSSPRPTTPVDLIAVVDDRARRARPTSRSSRSPPRPKPKTLELFGDLDHRRRR